MYCYTFVWLVGVCYGTGMLVKGLYQIIIMEQNLY
jgi:hypothetical protein